MSSRARALRGGLQALLLSLLAATVGAESAGLPAEAVAAPPSPTAPGDGAEGPEDTSRYRVGDGDILHVDVYDEKELSGDYTVSADGQISYSLLGRISVRGRTVREITAEITSRLEKDYLYDPKVSVTIVEFKSKRVELLGNVGKPGTYFIDRPMHIFDLLARAEGVSPRLGDIRRGQQVRITRGGAGAEPEQIYVELYELLVEGQQEANILIEPGDIIYVPMIRSVFVIGEVKNPGEFPFERGITVLKAITLAGGPTKKAALKEATIRRIQDGKEVRIKSRLENELEPDDIVEVEPSFW